MKYYSERLKKLFETEDELVQAEQKLDAEESERQKIKEIKIERLKEIEDAYKAVEDATSKYNVLVNKFIQDYGYYHRSDSRIIVPKSFYEFFLNYFPW